MSGHASPPVGRFVRMPDLVDRYRRSSREWRGIKWWYRMTLRFGSARYAAHQEGTAAMLADLGERKGFWIGVRSEHRSYATVRGVRR